MSQTRERLLLDPQWRFHLGDLHQVGAIHHGDTYASVKAGYAGGAAGPDFDDSGWREVDLPHDFVLEQPYDPTANVSHGFRRGAVGWYRKAFELPAEDLGRRLWLEFDGIFRDCTVWLNGHLLGSHRSGYIGCWFDVSAVANYGGRNVLAVRVDARDFEGWWYEGGGLYRHVWLSRMPAVHVDHWGVYVAPELNADFSQAAVAIQTTLVNDSPAAATVTLTSTVLDPSGQSVGEAEISRELTAGETVEVSQTVMVSRPQLWDIGSPHLYTLRTRLSSGDGVETPFGFRHIRFDAETGFHLNGRPVKLKGTCNHQDHAGVGLAMPDAILDYRVQRLQDMGGNAYRCAHNPPAPELLDVCDRRGMVVMDENRHLSCQGWGLADLEAMVKRDRNHPSVIMWSMANEEPLQSSEVGTRIVQEMIRRTRQLDPTRPTITAMHGGWGGSFSAAHDIQGCNYSLHEYDTCHAALPGQPILGSETSSALTTRGEYVTDPAKGYMSAYDVNCPPWGSLAGDAWRAVAERPFMGGTFVWTGFDYRGEPTPYEWPCTSSHFGIMDTCGFPKDNFFYYQAWWSEQPVLHLLPHWNWPARVGETIPVWVHSNCAEVELFLNGVSQGRQTVVENTHLAWDVGYEPGTLVARGYCDGVEIARATVETTGPAHQLRLIPHREQAVADGEDLWVVTAEVLDEAGRRMPIADDLITFAVSEQATILGVGNGDPSSKEPDKVDFRRAFNGLCQVIVQTRRGEVGEVMLTATAPGLWPGTVMLQAVTGPVRPWLPALPPPTA